MILHHQEHQQRQFVAYTPPVAPTTPAQRAQIAAALCERAKKRQAANAASNAAANARWHMEMTAIRQRQAQHPPSLSRPLPVTLSMPRQNAPSSAPVFAPQDPVVNEEKEEMVASSTDAATTTNPKYLVVSDEGEAETEIGRAKQTDVSAPVAVQSISVETNTEQRTASVYTEKSTTPMSDVTSSVPGAASGVVRPSVIDAIRTSFERLQSRGVEKDGTAEVGGEEEEGKEIKQVEGQSKFEAALEIPDQAGNASVSVDVSAMQPNVSDALGEVASKFEERESERKQQLSDKEAGEGEMLSQAVVVAGADSGVIRPSLVDAVGSFFLRLQLMKQIRQRITSDSKKLKDVGTAATVSGALTAFFSVKK